jgi:hypothetical protein
VPIGKFALEAAMSDNGHWLVKERNKFASHTIPGTAPEWCRLLGEWRSRKEQGHARGTK